LGTGHALKVAVEDIQDRKIKPERIFVGYGDHMMFYKPSVITEMDKLHNKDRAAVTLVTVVHDDPNSLAWGRIIRNNVGTVEAIVEQNDATESQKEITELNAGFYCFDYQFLLRNINKLQKSPVTGEYYITDLIELAIKNKLPVVAHLVPFKLVGIGINTRAQLVDASEML
jgi:bifunctional UDP-N-acetylglucosamine pyrophosphorylase/glucosamine-1-phosphate N-acetyltransferase